MYGVLCGSIMMHCDAYGSWGGPSSSGRSLRHHRSGAARRGVESQPAAAAARAAEVEQHHQPTPEPGSESPLLEEDYVGIVSKLSDGSLYYGSRGDTGPPFQILFPILGIEIFAKSM